MNFRVDVIIIGNSKASYNILNKIASKQSIELAFINTQSNNSTTCDYKNVHCFNSKVKYVSYKHRLFSCYMENGDNVFGTHLIVAPESIYEPVIINNKIIPNTFSSIDNVPSHAKDQTALVICCQDSDAKMAISVAKKYNLVYLCINTTDLIDCVSAGSAAKLNKLKNLMVIPNTSVKDVVLDENLAIQKIKLDNYTELECAAIFTSTASKPAIDFMPTNILPRENGYPVVSSACESTVVPSCFVAGDCLKKYTKTMEQKIIESIMKDF